MNFRLFLYIGLVSVLILKISCLDNPYKILGVDKKAGLPEIKKAYKQLAKEW
jgi:DnaJ-class molecular chaperone